MANEWYDNAMRLRDFAKALDDAGYVDSKDEVYEKPYRFDSEYTLWAGHDYPGQEDANWDEFTTALNSPDDEAEE